MLDRSRVDDATEEVAKMCGLVCSLGGANAVEGRIVAIAAQQQSDTIMHSSTLLVALRIIPFLLGDGNGDECDAIF